MMSAITTAATPAVRTIPRRYAASSKGAHVRPQAGVLTACAVQEYSPLLRGVSHQGLQNDVALLPAGRWFGRLHGSGV
jgi:hypothetical protein